MSRALSAVSFEGIRPDSLGNYLVGLGLLSALSRNWPGIRGSWHKGCFVTVGNAIEHSQIEQYLLSWAPAPYDRWWTQQQKADTKAKSDQNIWKARSTETIEKVRLLDSHIVGVERNQFNRVLGTGGKKLLAGCAQPCMQSSTVHYPISILQEPGSYTPIGLSTADRVGIGKDNYLHGLSS
jgi:hypothetical protein